MPKFKLEIEGTNFHVRLSDGIGKRRFVTIRFIEAADRTTAQRIAMNLIKEELGSALLNEPSDPPSIHFESVEELPASVKLPSQLGFIWF